MSNKSQRDAAKSAAAAAAAAAGGKSPKAAAAAVAAAATEAEPTAAVDSSSAPGAELLPTSSSSSSNKRARFDSSAGPETEQSEDASFTPEELAKMSRSERKRHREKKRRSDVNKGFDELMTLLLEIDPVVRAEAEDRARRGQWKGEMGAQEDNLLSRVDLIRRTVRVVRKIHEENEQRKLIIEELVRGQGGAGAATGGAAAALAGRVGRELLPGGATAAGGAAASQAAAAAGADRPSLLGASALSQAGAADPLTMGLLGQQQRQQQAAAQQRLSSFGFAPSDILGYTAHSFPGFPTAAVAANAGGLPPAAAAAAPGAFGNADRNRLALLEQIAKERDAAAMIAQARSNLQQGGRPF